MSRQGVVQQMPPLFLSQRQHQQLERNFTEPYRRQIAELQNQVEFWQTTSEEQQEQIQGLQDQVAGLVAAGTWPDTAEMVNSNRFFATNVIIWFSFDERRNEQVEILQYREIENSDRLHSITIPTGIVSALVMYLHNTNHISIYLDGVLWMEVDGTTEPYITYDSENNNRIIAFY